MGLLGEEKRHLAEYENTLKRLKRSIEPEDLPSMGGTKTTTTTSNSNSKIDLLLNPVVSSSGTNGHNHFEDMDGYQVDTHKTSRRYESSAGHNRNPLKLTNCYDIIDNEVMRDSPILLRPPSGSMPSRSGWSSGSSKTPSEIILDNSIDTLIQLNGIEQTPQIIYDWLEKSQYAHLFDKIINNPHLKQTIACKSSSPTHPLSSSSPSKVDFE
eukprot:gene12993-15283_t